MDKNKLGILGSFNSEGLIQKKAIIPDHSFENLRSGIESINKMNQDNADRIAKEKMEEKKYREDTLITLKNIEKNTGDISQLVFLLNTNTEKQNEILAIMTEILTIGTSKTEMEAKSKYRNVMSKITQTFEDADTMERLLGYSKVFYHSAIEYIKHKIENG